VIRIGVVTTAVALVAAGSTSAAAHRARPDLVVTKVAISRTSIVAGGALRATDTTKNAGTARARSSMTRYFIVGGSIRTAITSRSVRALSPHRSSTGSRIVITSRRLRPGTYVISACADAARVVREQNERNNCRSSQQFTVKAPPPRV
jgi:subtilase family serine protease